jgi:hypothetical protein
MDTTSKSVRYRRRLLRRLGITLSALLAAYGALVLRPHLLFAHQVRAGNVVLHARSALPPRAVQIAATARERLMRSPFYEPNHVYDVFLCDSPLLFGFFSLWDYRVGGVAHVYFTGNVFLRPANVERDRIIGQSGVETKGDRTLTYFVTHEISHTAVSRRLGRRRYHRLSRWQQEGYADYVAKAGAFDFPQVLADFKAGSPSLDPARSGLYLRYHLLVANLLDRKGLTPEQLLSDFMDDQPLEAELRMGEPLPSVDVLPNDALQPHPATPDR